MIAVLALGDVPLVEGLDHHHEAHLVAEFHEFGRGHVVRGADGVAAHFFQQGQLVAQGGLIDGGAERAKVVVVAHALDLAPLAVEIEALVGNQREGADAEAGLVLVQHGLVIRVQQPGLGAVEDGMFRRPGLRDGDAHLLRHRAVCLLVQSDAIASVGSPDGCSHPHAFPESRYLEFQLHRRLFGRQFCRPDARAPNGDMGFVGLDQVHVAVEAGAGVPARAVGQVFEADFQQVVLAVGVHERCHVGVEGVVAVGPFGHVPAVDAHLRLAHGAVEEQGHGVFSGLEVRHVKASAVPAFPHIRQAAGAAGMFGDAGFEVLGHLHGLEVVVAVEGAFDGPVVRHGHLRPCLAVAAEFPLGQQGFLPWRRWLRLLLARDQQ